MIGLEAASDLTGNVFFSIINHFGNDELNSRIQLWQFKKG